MSSTEIKHGAIGLFDSGVGGVTVVRQVRKYFPGERVVYLGDTIHVPYGQHSLTTIRSFALAIMEFLAQMPIRAIFMGCNTSAAALLETNLQHIQVPVFSLIVPGMLAAARATKTAKVGIIANPPTALSGVHQKVLDEYNIEVECTAIPCPKLVPLIESGKYDCPEMDAAMEEYLTPLMKAGCDVLIHGCTHYPLAQASIMRIWPDVKTVDPAEEMVRASVPLLRKQARFREPLEEDIYILTKEWPTFQSIVQLFLGETLPEPYIINIWEPYEDDEADFAHTATTLAD